MSRPHGARKPFWLCLLSAVLPAVIFYWLLWSSVVKLPIQDDYHAVLEFANGYSRLIGFGPKLLDILTFQQNEYKTVFASAIVATQYSLSGHISFGTLMLIGDAFVLPLSVVLIALYRVPGENRVDTFLLLLPVSLLLFQLQYASTLNWAGPSLQNIPVIVFALFSIYLLARNSFLSFAGACLSLLLAIASSGNGLAVAPIGLLLLLQQRRWKQMGLWVLAALVATAGYFYHYNFLSSQAAPQESVVHSFARLNPAYALSFMGSSLAGSQSYLPAVCAGLVLCAVLLWMLKRRYYLANPAAFYSAIFIVLTAVGVSGIRSGFGISQSLASRYRIYSDLLLILAYIFLSETYWARLQRLVPNRRMPLAIFIFLCAGFCAASDRAGYRFLLGRRETLLYEMAKWQHPSTDATSKQLENRGDPIFIRHLQEGIYKPDGPMLLESARLGVYALPPLD